MKQPILIILIALLVVLAGAAMWQSYHSKPATPVTMATDTYTQDQVKEILQSAQTQLRDNLIKTYQSGLNLVVRDDASNTYDFIPLSVCAQYVHQVVSSTTSTL